MTRAGKHRVAALIALIALLFAVPALANADGALTEPTPVPTAQPTPAPSAALPSWKEAYQNYFDEARIRDMRCFMMLADLDFNGTPELLFGTLNRQDGQVEVDVLTISGDRAVPAQEGTINGAYNLNSVNLTLYREKKSYQWTLVTTGNESPNGRWQTRHSEILFVDGGVRHLNRFTKRTSLGSSAYYVEGARVSRETYEKQFARQRAKLKAAGSVPKVALGGHDEPPTLERVRQAFASLVPRYEQFARPSKIKLLAEKKKLKLNEKVKTKLEVSTSYGAATKSAVAYSVSDPEILSVNAKGSVKAVGYGSAAVIATLPSGVKAGVKISVPRPKVKKVAVSSDSATMKKGERMQMYYKLSPAASRARVRWRSSDTSVIRVDEQTGMATALKRGSALISCYAGAKLRGSRSITVENGEFVSEIALSDERIQLTLGDRYALGVKLSPDSATNKTLDFQSSDQSVAVVNQMGRITAKGQGTATITATAFGGAKASVEVGVGESSYQMDAGIADGAYEFILPRQGAPLLMLDDCEPEEGAPLVPRMRQGVPARMRFLVENVGDGAVEIRPVVDPSMYLAIRDDGGGARLGVFGGAPERERRFKLTRFPDGSCTLYLAARPTASFGVSGEQLGAPAQAVPYAETDDGLRFRLSPVGVLPGAPDVPGSWIERVIAMLGGAEAALDAATHIQLCDLDFNGSPELIVFTDRHDKSLTHSLTARRALIYSGDAGAGLLGSFEYEPHGSDDFQDALPRLRLMVNQQTGSRGWILTDGTSDNAAGSARYVAVGYAEGIAKARTLFEKSWRPLSGTDGAMDERFYAEDKEVTRFVYEREFQKQFENCVWRDGASEIVDVRGENAEQLEKRLRALLARDDWFR